MRFHIPNALHLPALGPDGRAVQLTDAYGKQIDGNIRPQWDTLIGLYNDETFQVTARFLFWRDDGSRVIWPSGREYGEVLLKPKSSWACTFIPGNGFPEAPPLNWAGHGIIDILPNPFQPQPKIHAWAMIGGGNWDKDAPSVNLPLRETLPSSTRWIFAYVIPVFEDLNHPGPRAYTTGLSIANFSNQIVPVTIRYSINQNYPEYGRQWEMHAAIAPNGTFRKHLSELLAEVGYPDSLNSEGHLEILSNLPAPLFPYAIVATKDYLFSAGADFSN